MVKIRQTGLLKLNFESIPKKRIFRFLTKIFASHRWSRKFFFANFQILGPLVCQGWVVIPQNVKKAKITAPYCPPVPTPSLSIAWTGHSVHKKTHSFRGWGWGGQAHLKLQLKCCTNIVFEVECCCRKAFKYRLPVRTMKGVIFESYSLLHLTISPKATEISECNFQRIFFYKYSVSSKIIRSPAYFHLIYG
jgi:hypothetical protein